MRAVRAGRSLGERTVTELILQHQNPQQLSANLWAAVRARGCQFLGPGECVLRYTCDLEDTSGIFTLIEVALFNVSDLHKILDLLANIINEMIKKNPSSSKVMKTA